MVRMGPSTQHPLEGKRQTGPGHHVRFSQISLGGQRNAARRVADLPLKSQRSALRRVFVGVKDYSLVMQTLRPARRGTQG